MQRTADVTTELHSAVQQLNITPVCVCVSLFIINTVSFVRSRTKQNNRAETLTTHTDTFCIFYCFVSCFSQVWGQIYKLHRYIFYRAIPDGFLKTIFEQMVKVSWTSHSLFCALFYPQHELTVDSVCVCVYVCVMLDNQTPTQSLPRSPWELWAGRTNLNFN